MEINISHMIKRQKINLTKEKWKKKTVVFEKNKKHENKKTIEVYKNKRNNVTQKIKSK